MKKHGGKREGAGRPPKDGEVLDETLQLRCTKGDLTVWKKRAAEKPVSEWARAKLNE